jgi:hypothetical protein
MNAGADRPDVAKRYAADVRQGLDLMADGRARSPGTAGQLRIAVYRAAIGVLRYSELDEDLELASGALRRLVELRERRALDDVVAELRDAGATIPPAAAQAVLDRRIRLKLERELEGLGIGNDRLRA